MITGKGGCKTYLYDQSPILLLNMRYPPAIQKLIEAFSQLPTVGPKTAERYVFYLLKQDSDKLKNLAEAILELKSKNITCSNCNTIAESNPCPICSDSRRNQKTICIISDARDLMTIEATGLYGGRYFVLNGELNQFENIGPDQLNAEPLLNKLKNNGIEEVILALNPTIEGETTAMYLIKLIKPLGKKITRLAKGLPMGANLEYVDELTLTNAFKFRNEI